VEILCLWVSVDSTLFLRLFEMYQQNALSSISALHIGVYTQHQFLVAKEGNLTGQTQCLLAIITRYVQVLFSSTLKYIHNNILPKIFKTSIIMLSPHNNIGLGSRLTESQNHRITEC